MRSFGFDHFVEGRQSVIITALIGDYTSNFTISTPNVTFKTCKLNSSCAVATVEEWKSLESKNLTQELFQQNSTGLAGLRNYNHVKRYSDKFITLSFAAPQNSIPEGE